MPIITNDLMDLGLHTPGASYYSGCRGFKMDLGLDPYVQQTSSHTCRNMGYAQDCVRHRHLPTHVERQAHLCAEALVALVLLHTSIVQLLRVT